MKKIETITITKQLSYVLMFQAVILFFIGGAIFSSATGTNDFESAGYAGIIAFFATIVVHEMLHGVGFLMAGARPRFGVGIIGIMPIAYASSDSKVKVPGMLFTAYLPFVLLSVIFIAVARIFPQYQALVMIGFIGNFAGAVGDLWIASKLWKYLPYKDVLVHDIKNGIEIFSDNKQAAIKGAKATKKALRTGTFAKNWAVCFLVIMIIQLFMPALLSALDFEGNFRFGFENFYFFEMTLDQQGTRSASISLVAPLILSFVISAIVKLTSRKGKINR